LGDSSSVSKYLLTRTTAPTPPRRRRRRAEIFGASVDGTVRRFDLRMGAVVTDDLHSPVTCVAVSRDGRCVAAACTDARVRLLDRDSGALLGEYAGHAHASSKLDAAFMPSDGYVAAGSEDGRVVYWEVVEGGVAAEFEAHGDVVTSLAVHPRGECLLTASVDGTVKVWN
jgi:mitogen-activated protein kinase organizer 1